MAQSGDLGVCVGGSSAKEQWPLPTLLSWRKQTLSALTPKADNSVPPWMSLTCLSSRCSNAGAQSQSVQVRLRMGPLRGTAWDSKNPVSVSHNPHWFSQPKVIRTALPGTWTLDCGSWCGAGAPCSSGATSTAEISSQFSTATCRVVSAHSVSPCSFHHSHHGFFFMSSVTGTLFRQISGSSQQ